MFRCQLKSINQGAYISENLIPTEQIFKNFYMPGEADGKSSRQYSPCSPVFLYLPYFESFRISVPLFVLLPDFELCKGYFGFFRVPFRSRVF